MSFRFQLIFAFGLLMTIFIVVGSYVIYSDKKATLEGNLKESVYHFTLANSQNVVDVYKRYYESAFLSFKREIQNIMELSPDVVGVRLFSYNGEVFYDSQIEHDTRYTGDEQRKTENKELLDRIQMLTPTVRYIDKDLKEVVDSFSLDQQLDGRIQNIVYPLISSNGDHRYSVLYEVSYDRIIRDITVATSKFFI